MFNCFKVDSSGFQGNFAEPLSASGTWQNSLAPPHPHYHSSHPPVRLPYMPSRDVPFPSQNLRPFRPSSSPLAPEYRIFDLNKRLSMRTEDCDQHWWETFANEFFEDDAILTISMCLDEGPKRFNISRILIPRFFRSLFDGGVNDVYFSLKYSKEIFHHPTISLDCEQGAIIFQFGKPSFIKVCTEGHFIFDFMSDDLMRIKSCHFNIRQHRELIPRSVVAIPTDNPMYLDQLSKNYVRYGLTPSMINFLRFSEILEPMLELMSRHKTSGFPPRDCLKTVLHQRWSKTCSDPRGAPPPPPPQSAVTTKTRRKRKSNPTNGSSTATTPTSKEMSTPNPPTPTKKRSSTNSISSQNSNSGNNLAGDVMIVGEPSLMGDEMDEEDERFITRLENNQYNTSFSQSKGVPSFQNHPIKIEQTSSPNQQQQQQMLPSMFSLNGENSNASTIRRISNSPSSLINETKQESQTPPPPSVTSQQSIVTA